MTDTRSKLISAAVAHLNSDGLTGLTLREIARAAGVSHGAPARHFPSLAALLATVAAHSFDGLRTSVTTSVQQTNDNPLSQLAAAGSGYVEFATTNPHAYELMFRPELLDRTEPSYLIASQAAFQQLATLTAEAQRSGWRTRSDHLTLTGVLWASVHGLASLTIQGVLATATNIESVSPFLELFQEEFTNLSIPGTTP